MAVEKTHNNKKSFIQTLSMMSDTEINDYIKRHGKRPKRVEMCRIIDKQKHEVVNENK